MEFVASTEMPTVGPGLFYNSDWVPQAINVCPRATRLT